MPLSGHLATTDDDVLLGPGVVRVSSTNLGVTRGGTRFTPGWEYVPLEFDGRHAPIKGLERKFYGTASVSFTLLDIGHAGTGAQISKLEANSSAATAGSPSVTTITGADAGALHGTYLTDFRLIFDRGAGSGTTRYFAIYFPCALVTRWELTDTDPRGYAGIEVTVEARKDIASGDIQDCPYAIEYREALP